MKMNLSAGKPETLKAAIAALGPGIGQIVISGK
jgi:hypothetical protein